jgi:ATP-dependent DNA helicase RecG
MSAELHVFVSFVQKVLEDERLIVQNLINTDHFLSVHCVPVLYEFEPASPDKATEECLKTLEGCQVYLLIVGLQYGTRAGELSITHTEYRCSKEKKIPILAFIKGDRKAVREDGTDLLLRELDADGLKYKRFGNVIELQKEVRAALVKLLKEQFGIAPSSDEDKIAQQTIEATSSFESQPLPRLRWQDLDHEVLRRLIAVAENRDAGSLSTEDLWSAASARGLVWRDQGTGENYATAAGIVLLARDPCGGVPPVSHPRRCLQEYGTRRRPAGPRGHPGADAAGDRSCHRLYRPQHPPPDAYRRAQPRAPRRVPCRWPSRSAGQRGGAPPVRGRRPQNYPRDLR